MIFLAKGTTGTKALRTTEVKGLPKVSTLLRAWHFFTAASTSKLSPGPSGKGRGQGCTDQFQPSVKMGSAGAGNVDQPKQPRNSLATQGAGWKSSECLVFKP